MTDKSTTELTNSSEQLKPCPFCGSEPELTTWGADTRTGAPFHQIECCECGCSIGHSSDPLATHVANWNSRSAAHGDQSFDPIQEISRLVSENDKLRAINSRLAGSAEQVIERGELLRELDWCIENGHQGVRSQKLLKNLRSFLTAATATNEQEAYEQFMRGRMFIDSDFRENELGQYKAHYMQTHWEVWQARAALNQKGEQTAPEGCVIVPKEPPKMGSDGDWLLAVRDEFNGAVCDWGVIDSIYRAMIAAAPSTAQKDGYKS